MATFTNHVTIHAPANGTTSHTVDPSSGTVGNGSLFTPTAGRLLVVQLVAGCAWAAVELATTLSFFEGIAEEDRASVLSVFNFANALAIVAGALIGAAILSRFETSAHLYAWLFAASTLGRLLAASLLGRTPAAGRGGATIQLRTLAVRPSGVAVQRPILASLGHREPDASGARGHPEEGP